MALDQPLVVDGRALTIDIAYGGAFFALVDARLFGLSLSPRDARACVEIGEKIKAAAQAQYPVSHPLNPDIHTITFVQFTLPPEQASTMAGEPALVGRNAVVVSPGKIDRSPCGTGTSARLAVMHARGTVGVGTVLSSRSIIDTEFVGKIEEVVPLVEASVHSNMYIYMHYICICILYLSLYIYIYNFLSFSFFFFLSLSCMHTPLACLFISLWLVPHITVAGHHGRSAKHQREGLDHEHKSVRTGPHRPFSRRIRPIRHMAPAPLEWKMVDVDDEPLLANLNLFICDRHSDVMFDAYRFALFALFFSIEKNTLPRLDFKSITEGVYLFTLSSRMSINTEEMNNHSTNQQQDHFTTPSLFKSYRAATFLRPHIDHTVLTPMKDETYNKVVHIL